MTADNNQDQKGALSGLKKELEDIRAAFNDLRNRIAVLEIKISALPKEEMLQPAKEVLRQEPPRPVVKERVAVKKDVEADLGKFWLNKIGIIIFTLGIAFFIAYAFRYFGPAAKIAFGYVLAAALFFFGQRQQKKEKFVNYGRVLLAGAWAIIYFTTYAMYHFDASKIINNQLLDLFLLTAVALGMIFYYLRYKSEALTAVSLFIAYFTATLGDVTYFTFWSCALLAIVTLTLVYKLQWLKFIFLGIFFTYFTHFFWTIKQIYFSTIVTIDLNTDQAYFLINGAFLTLYWFLFTAGVHLIREDKERKVYNKLAAAELCNFIFYFFMVYPKLIRLFPAQKFNFIFFLGIVYLVIALIMLRARKEKLFTSNMAIALSLLTLAVPLKFIFFHTNLVWLVELPFLVFFGFAFRQKVFRYFSFALAFLLFFKWVTLDFSKYCKVAFFGGKIACNNLIAFIGLASLSACFLLSRTLKKRNEVTNLEENFGAIYSGLATIYLTMFLWLILPLEWLTFTLAMEALFIIGAGVLLQDKFLRLCYLALVAVMAYRFTFIDTHAYFEAPVKWLMVGAELIALSAGYFLYRRIRNKALVRTWEPPLVRLIFVILAFLCVVAVHIYVTRTWISLGLGALGVLLFITGFLAKDKIFRLAGFLIFGLTLLRVVFVDLVNLPVIYKIISFIILGILFLGVSYIYTRYGTGKAK
ncbi:MAG: DUF2339 domain-containing protein [Candidatus Omnitrophica bacterium]|nr:DUF2339 domain-containing protein [Candidatus Omnitrophota bacterium]